MKNKGKTNIERPSSPNESKLTVRASLDGAFRAETLMDPPDDAFPESACEARIKCQTGRTHYIIHIANLHTSIQPIRNPLNSSLRFLTPVSQLLFVTKIQ